MAPETQHHRRLPGVCACHRSPRCLKRLRLAKKRSTAGGTRLLSRFSFLYTWWTWGRRRLHFPAPVRPVTAKGQEVKHVRGPPRWSASKLCTSSSAMSRTPATPRSTGSFYSSKLPPVAETFDSLSRKKTFLGWSLTVLVMKPSNLGLGSSLSARMLDFVTIVLGPNCCYQSTQLCLLVCSWKPFLLLLLLAGVQFTVYQ